MSSFLDQLLDWLLPLFANWGYLIVFTGVFLESIFVTGWIAPGTTVLLIGSFFAARGELNIFMVWATSVMAALLGDNVGYFIGRRMGRGVKERYDEGSHVHRGMERSQGFFDRYGGITVLFGRMISGIDAFIPVTAGMNGMPHWRYMAYDVPGTMLWSGIFSALGYFFGENWRTIDKVINALGWGMLGILALIVVIVLLIRRRRKGKETIVAEGGDERR
ncbi:MAG: DedA family protein [Actinobacteria bacterium]|nr:DedA family protein [Actinomycetota bacterium]